MDKNTELQLLPYCDKKDIDSSSHDFSNLQLLWYFVALPSVLPSGPQQPFEHFPCDNTLWLDAAVLIKKSTEFIK